MKSNTKSAKSVAPKVEEPKGKKLFVFKVLSILFPIIFLIFLELVLRFFNYGVNTDLFIKFPPDERYMVMNYYVSNKFFPDTADATKGNQEIFAINKAPNTVRIFVLGESTTLGYPFRPNGSFHRWLQYRLMQMYPDKNFEVINLSLTAVNSYTILDFGKQLAQYQPDAVLIYVGHNEYYGALGIGSTTYVGSNRFLVQTLIKLREFRSVQVLNNCVKKIASVFASHKTGDRNSLMQDMAARQHIAYNSADYKAGISQFDKNMTELCSTLNDEKIPTFFSTVVSNEKDLTPFISEGDGTGSANWYYNAGQIAYSKASYNTAKQDFDKAKELDELRFRAPEAINASIKKIAGKYPFVHLVDSKKMIEQNSPHSIIGAETIEEHVHPNLFGYAIISEAFYQAIQQQQLIKENPEREISFDELRKEMPITKLDSLDGKYQIMMLKTGWPFNQPISKQFKAENSAASSFAVKVALGHMGWTNAMGELYRYDIKNNNNQEAVKVVEAMVLQYPQSEDFYNLSGNLNNTLKNYGQAAFYYRKLFMLNNNPQIAQTVYQLYLKADDPVNALKFVQYSPQQDRAKTALTQIIKDKISLKAEPNNITLKQLIVTNYKVLGVDTVK
jgi:tetratricopeptide (TPR) repeat protein